MSELTHIERPLRVRLPLPVTLAVVALIAGGFIALFFALSPNEEASQAPTPLVSDTAPGLRYDGVREVNDVPPGSGVALGRQPEVQLRAYESRSIPPGSGVALGRQPEVQLRAYQSRLIPPSSGE